MPRQKPKPPPVPDTAPAPSSESGRPDPLALTPAQAAALLGSPVTAAWVEADIAAGCPTNADGTLNLVAYCAWLAAQDR
jgi:hypothetical protein